MKIPNLSAALLCAAASVYAVETKTWSQDEMADFEKATLTHLSLSSEGRITLAPVVKEIFDPSVTFLWAVARDSKGTLYAGGGGLGGSKAKLFAVDATGKSRTVAELDGMSIQAIAVDRQDRVYAATSPDGKIYRIETSGKTDIFYDPKAKYIWALAFSKSGDLFVATGDEGEIHRVNPSGRASVFFKTEETHARSLAVDANDNLIVGTDPSGLVVRINPSGQGFVLYQAPKREITALGVAPDGTIYAAGVGTKQLASAQAVAAPAPPAAPPAPAAGANVTLPANRPAATPPSTAPAAVVGGSEIYRIQADGYPRRVWTSGQDIVYAIAFDGRGRALAGTGNHGAIYRIDSERSYTRLLAVEPTQVTGFCASADGRIYAVTGNIGKILSIGPELESSGVLESDVFDAGAFSYWGRLTADGKETGSIRFETRSGNLNRPQKNWSEWATLNNGRVASPSARFLQYRATIAGSAELAEVDVAYLMKNVAPVVEEIETTPANYKFPAPVSAAAAVTPTLTLPALGRARSASAGGSSADSGTSPTMMWSKGWIGARWLANDDNGDALMFKLEIRGVSESNWKLVRDKIREHYYSWDSTAFPDGKYLLRVTASDAPANPPDQALTGSLESDPFLIDNTPPEISALLGSPAGAKIEVRFHAKDALSNIGKAEYSINGGDWIVVEPVTRLTDSMDEDYRFSVDRGQGEATIAVRVSDEYDNQAVAKVVVK